MWLRCCFTPVLSCHWANLQSLAQISKVCVPFHSIMNHFLMFLPVFNSSCAPHAPSSTPTHLATQSQPSAGNSLLVTSSMPQMPGPHVFFPAFEKRSYPSKDTCLLSAPAKHWTSPLPHLHPRPSKTSLTSSGKAANVCLWCMNSILKFDYITQLLPLPLPPPLISNLTANGHVNP